MAGKRRPKGEGGLYQRADGRWAYAADLGRDPKTGKRLRRVLYAWKKADLLRKVADLRARGGGAIRPRAAGTLGEWVERWLRDDVKPNRSANTYALYESMFRVHTAAIVGNLPLENFDVPQADMLIARLRAEGKSVSVIHRVCATLRTALNVAIRKRIYHRANPFDAVDLSAPRPKEARVLTADEARRFLHAAREDRYEALWTLLLTAGLRLGEALGLEWRDVDLERRSVSLQRAAVEVSGRVEIGAMKTKGSRRRVEIGALTLEALRRRRKAWEAEGRPSPLVFATESGTPLRRSNLRQRHFDSVCKASGIKGLTIHGLRHSMTSLALAEGIPAKVLAERLGHSTTRLTEDRYAHVLPGLQREAADKLDAVLRKRSRGPKGSNPATR